MRSWAGPIRREAGSHIGALLLGYHTADVRLHDAGRAGTGVTDKGLKRLAGVLAPLRVLLRQISCQAQREDKRSAKTNRRGQGG